MGRIWKGLDERLGLGQAWERRLAEPLAGGPRWSASFAGALAIILGVQLISGMTLALHYSPSTRTAWESVFYIEEIMTLGSWVRALHHHGASFIIALAGLHLLQVLAFGAYRKPRDLTWWTGLACFGLLFVFALTGYLLPWDERGYGATQVATGLIALTPWIGEPLKRIALGGDTYGHLTLTRFYATHIIVLPTAFAALLGLHWLARRGHRLAPSPSSAAAAPSAPWALQLRRHLILGALAVGALFALAATTPAPLTAPADPATAFPARPEWYFLPLFQLLKQRAFSGPREVIGSHAIPALLVFILAALPFLDKGQATGWRGRLRFIIPAGALVLGAILLGLWARSQDASDVGYANEVILGKERENAARTLARDGIPSDGALAMLKRSAWNGARVYADKCARCHEGPRREGPQLKGYLSIDWVARLIRDPNSDEFYGRTKLGKEGLMLAYKIPEADRQALAAFLLEAGSEEQRVQGQKLYSGKQDCTDCHERQGGLAGAGPNLAGYGSRDWIAGLIKKPAHLLYYGENSKMPPFGEELSADEMEAIITWLRRQGGHEK